MAMYDQTTVELMVVTKTTIFFLDRGKHGETRVEIVGGVSDFLLQSYGGGSLNVIKVSSLAKFRRGHVYNLTLKATDFGTPPRASVASLTIKVITLLPYTATTMMGLNLRALIFHRNNKKEGRCSAYRQTCF